MRNEIFQILQELNNQIPLSNIISLENVSNISWENVSDDDFDLLSDLIIRITADLIVFKAKEYKCDLIIYRKIFEKIRSDIISSGLPGRSQEFKMYFDKFCQYF